MQRLRERPVIRVIAVAVLVLASYAPMLAPMASAAGFTETFLRLDRLATTVTTSGVVCAKSANAGTERGLKVTFPTTVTLTGAPTVAGTTSGIVDPGGGTVTAWPGIGAAAVTQSGQVVTIAWGPGGTSGTTGDLTSSTALYCFTFSAVATLGTAGSATSAYAGYIRSYSNGTPANMDATSLLDETPYAISIVGNSPTDNDQIIVTAVVPPLFSFALSGYSDPFTLDLDPAAIRNTTGITATVTTNAKGGWIAWAKDSQAGLHSTAASYTIPSTGAASGSTFSLTAGTEGYLMHLTLLPGSGPCTLNAEPEFTNPSSNLGGKLTTSFKQIAECTGSAPATSTSDQISMQEIAAIRGSTPAASDYTDTITVVGAGDF